MSAQPTTSSEVAWLRPLGDTEACLWHGDRASRFNFVMMADLGGDVEPEQLRAALSHVQARHPLFAASVRVRGRWPWFAHADRPIPLDVREAPDEDAWRAAAEVEMEAPFAPERGPLVRCVWLRRDATRSVLLMTFHHVIGDGISGAYALRDLLEALAHVRGEREAMVRRALPVSGPLDRHMPGFARGLGRWWRYTLRVGAVLGWLARNGRARGLIHDQRGVDPVTRKPCLIARRLEPDVTARLVARARREGTTVHGALCAAMLGALADERAQITPAMMASPVNLRDRMEPPVEDDVGFFVSMGVVLHRADPSPDAFWDTARASRDALVRFVETGGPFTMLPVQNALLVKLVRWTSPQAFARLVYRGQLDGIGLTNIGRAKLATQYGGVTVRALGFAASLGVLGDFAATAASLDGVLCWNFMAMEPTISRAHAERVADRCVARLLAALEDESA